MIEQAFSQLGKQLDERIKLPTGVLVCAVIISFVIGILTGSLVSNIINSRKIKAITSADEEEFDAEEYLRNLDLDDFDDDEE